MSIIGKVGRKSPKVRILNLALHLILILGSLTMIYPFVLMISSSLKSNVDGVRITLIPPYLHSDEALYQKYLESRYNEESSRLMDNYPGSWISFAEVELEEDKANPALYELWKDFLRDKQEQISVFHYYVAEHYGRGIYPLAQRLFRAQLREENQNSLVEFNNRYGTGAVTWEEIVVEEKDIYSRNFVSSDEGYLGRFRRFKETTPLSMRYYVNPDGSFVNNELIPAYGGKLELFNRAHQTSYSAWNQIRLPVSVPAPGDSLREIWLHYVRSGLNLQHLKLAEEAGEDYRGYLRGKYGSILLLNQAWKTGFDSFGEVQIPARMPESGAEADDLAFYIQSLARPEHLRINSLAEDFRSYIYARMGSLETINTFLKTDYTELSQIPFPSLEQDYYAFEARKGEIRREFLWRNYAMALDQMLSDARSLRNTGIYVLLSILLAITVNPLAAYALSRFKPRFSYQLIMLFMLTMAFPAMVMGIPNFLMLKRLNLLNTFWALVLPAAADGYFIFLLKGFFDSLPKEIYESASIDGAGEFRLFWQFTLWLSKPILAVIALGAFNAAYRNFLFAFIVCQDQSMWTLMVHIYTLMQRASTGVGYAALVIAAIPTLLIFVFFQNIIIKGIVVPMEK